MRTQIVTGFALASAALLSACAPGYDGYAYYYPSPYYYGSGYYYGCYGPYQPSYCFPAYSGTVVIAGTPYRDLPYREGPYGREFWFDGRWVRG
jgi:hypothetical protein